ncbi:MAG: 3-dehydroquinate synthase [Solobacterium sp.]|nr:3-dehydroquinate synthase [Solobacterium sp.]
MELTVKTASNSYPILIERGALKNAGRFVSGEKVFLISDDGVPEQWRNLLQAQFPDAPMHVIPQGEGSKCFEVMQEVLAHMLEEHLSRRDTVIALGGGVVGDLSGFCAATYMRGIRYINIPTTMLAMVDSSIGGKTAVDFHGIKNCVGAFWHPSAVIVDPDVLSTLSPRLLHEGMAEAVKMGLTHDAALFELFEHEDYMDHLDEIILRSLQVKKGVVERDEREGGERKLLNFGHTYGHAYESLGGLNKWLHGECVAMGMMTVIRNPGLRSRLAAVLERLQLPTAADCDKEAVCRLIKSDKKADHDTVTIVQVDEPGHGVLELWDEAAIRKGAGLS